MDSRKTLPLDVEVMQRERVEAYAEALDAKSAYFFNMADDGLRLEQGNDTIRSMDLFTTDGRRYHAVEPKGNRAQRRAYYADRRRDWKRESRR